MQDAANLKRLPDNGMTALRQCGLAIMDSAARSEGPSLLLAACLGYSDAAGRRHEQELGHEQEHGFALAIALANVAIALGIALGIADRLALLLLLLLCLGELAL